VGSFLVRSFVVREFKFEVQQSNSFSLQRSETGGGTIAEAGEGDCAPTELGRKKDRQAINISPLWGEEPNNFSLHFEVESTVSSYAA